MTQLPLDVVRTILSFSEPEELVRLTESSLITTLLNAKFWEDKFRREFDVVPEKPIGINWPATYKYAVQNFKSLEGKTVYGLYWAIRNDNYDIYKLLMNDLNIQGTKCFIDDPVYYSVYYDRPTFLKLALKYPQMNFLRASGKPEGALEAACRLGRTEMVKMMVDSGRVDPSERRHLVFYYAVKYGNAEMIQYLLKDPRVDPAFDDNAALMMATSKGHAEVVEVLLRDPRVDPDNVKETVNNVTAHVNLLPLAMKEKRWEVVRVLLNDDRIGPCADNDAIMKKFVIIDRIAIVKILLNRAFFDTDEQRLIVLKIAIEMKHLSIIYAVISHPHFDPSYKRNAALKEAIQGKVPNLVETFIEDPRIDPSFPSNEPIILAMIFVLPQILTSLAQNRRVVRDLQHMNELIDIAKVSGYERAVIILEEVRNKMT